MDLVGNIVGRTETFDLVAHDIENAARLQARRGLVITEMNGDLHANPRILAETQEVDMQDGIAHRLELDLARNNPHGLAADIEIDERRGKASGADLPGEVAVVQGDQLRLFPVAINDPRNQTFPANRPGSSLAGSGARGRLQRDNFRHGGTP